MTYLTAFVLIIIIVLTSIIIYNLNLENKFIREATKKEMTNAVVEGFSSTSIKDASNFPLREFIIQSSYNSAIKDNKASKEQLTELLNKGVRVLDFEIYTRRGDEYISYAEDKEYRRLETDLDLSVADAFGHIASKAFSEPNSGPLFLHLRIKTPSSKTFERLASTIQNAFGSKLLAPKTQVNGSTFIQDLTDKVVLIHDLTSGTKPENYPCRTDKCIQYVDLINIFSGTIDLPLYTQLEYVESMGLTKKISINAATGETDIDTFYMVTPSSWTGNTAESLIETMQTKPCQMMLLSFNDDTDKEIQNYLSIFQSAGTSFCPVSQLIKKNNIET